MLTEGRGGTPSSFWNALSGTLGLWCGGQDSGEQGFGFSECFWRPCVMPHTATDYLGLLLLVAARALPAGVLTSEDLNEVPGVHIHPQDTPWQRRVCGPQGRSAQQWAAEYASRPTGVPCGERLPGPDRSSCFCANKFVSFQVCFKEEQAVFTAEARFELWTVAGGGPGFDQVSRGRARQSADGQDTHRLCHQPVSAGGRKTSVFISSR